MTSSNSLFNLPSRMMEAGLWITNSALETMQATVETVTRQKRPGQLRVPPVDGPANLDWAVADFANRLAAIARFSPWDASGLGPAFEGLLNAARRSFQYADLRDPRSLALPFQVALSVGTLLTQQGLRGLATYEAVGARTFPRFVADVIEMFTDIQIFVGLEYRDLIRNME